MGESPGKTIAIVVVAILAIGLAVWSIKKFALPPPRPPVEQIIEKQKQQMQQQQPTQQRGY